MLTMEAIQINAYTEKHRRTQYLTNEILRSDWLQKKFSIWREDDVSLTLNKADNWDIYVGKMLDKRVGNYRDPRITRRADSVSWVRAQGLKYRGQNEIGAAMQAERRNLIEQEMAREGDANKS